MSGPTRREYLDRTFNNFPEVIRKLPVWLLWKWINPGNTKERKVPFYANGEPRNGALDTEADRSKLVTFEEAAVAFSDFDQYYGLGVALGDVPGEEIRLSGIDLDDIDASDERAVRIIAAAHSYAEVSPSGTGLKIFGSGAIVAGGGSKSEDKHLEIYDGKRFFAVTGQALNGSHIADLSAAAEVARSIFLPKKAALPVQVKECRADSTNVDVSAVALQHLDRWVEACVPQARLRENGIYRASALSLGRDTQEDLVFAPGGIMDYGASHETHDENAGRSAVQIVMTFTGRSFQEANDWLRARIGLPKFEPAKREPSKDTQQQVRSIEVPDAGSRAAADEDMAFHYEAREQADMWGAPLDLWTERPVLPLDVRHLPGPIQAYVQDQSELIGTDTTVIALSALITCASVIDDRYRVQPKQYDTSWTEPARLWAAIVGDPSAKKSPGMLAALRPLRKIDAQAAQDAERDMKHYQRELDEYTGTSKKNRSGGPPEKPVIKRNIVSNTTVEALSEILKDNPQGVLCIYDELSGWFGSMDIYGKGGGGKDRAMWLEAYNGGPQRIDRIQRGQIFIPNWSACVLGGIQPDAFRTVASKMDNDGLLQRFMIVQARNAQPDTDRPPNKPVIEAYHTLISSLRQRTPNGPDEVVYELSEEAQEVRRRFMQYVDAAGAGLLPKGMAGYLGKWSGLFARLLCAYHIIEHVGACAAIPRLIAAATATQVCEFMELCLYRHGYQFYAEQMGRTDDWGHVRWVAGHLLSKRLTTIATRDLIQAYRPMRNMTLQEKTTMLSSLVEYQWIRPNAKSRVNATTRLATNWDVNPVVFETFLERGEIEKRERAAKREELRLRTDM